MSLARREAKAITLALLSDVQDQLLRGDVGKGMDRLIRGLKEIRSMLVLDEWMELANTEILAHPLARIIHQCPFTQHAYRRPRGYPGDADLLDYIYGCKPPPLQLEPLARAIYEHCIQTSVPQSVRDRCRLLSEKIDTTVTSSVDEVQLVSVACGHLRELQDTAAMTQPGRARIIAYDQDPMALEVVKSQYPNKNVETICGSVATLIRSGSRRTNFHLVYAAGLYDYLSQDLAAKLTRQLFAMVRAGGQLLIANFAPEHGEIGYMEAFMRWNLVYRTPEQLSGVTALIDKSMIASQRLFDEGNGIIYFLEVTKAS